MSKILNKQTMYALQRAGRLGNAPRSWANFQEMRDSGYTGNVWVRSLVIDRPFRLSEVSPVVALTFLMQHSIEPGQYTIGEAPSNSKRTVQGELMRCPGGYYLYYTTLKKPMRPALEEGGRHAVGICALTIMQTMVDPASWDDIQELLDTYDGATIEFSSFSVPVGTMPTRNTLVWEVRHY